MRQLHDCPQRWSQRRWRSLVQRVRRTTLMTPTVTSGVWWGMRRVQRVPTPTRLRGETGDHSRSDRDDGRLTCPRCHGQFVWGQFVGPDAYLPDVSDRLEVVASIPVAFGPGGLARTAEGRVGVGQASRVAEGRYDDEFRRSGAIWSRPGTEMRSSVSDMSSTATGRRIRTAATPMPTSRPFGTSTICCRQSRPTSASTGRRRLPISTSTDPRHIQVTTSSTSSDLTSTGARRSPSTTTRGAVVSSRLCNRTSTSHRNGTSRCRTRNGAAPR